MKNKLITLLVLLLCFIPSAAAYSNYQKTQNAPVDADNAVSISITDVKEKEFTLSKGISGDDADQLISFFVSMRDNANQIVALPDSLMGQKFFIVKLSTNVKTESYEFYFSLDPTANYFRAQDGTTYKIAENDAAQFITSQYAESLYEQASMPVLTLSNTYDVTPDKAVWQYKNYTGNYVDSDVTSLTSEAVESYDVEGGINLSFDSAPDNCTVIITDPDGNMIFENSLDMLPTFRSTESEIVTINVVANWYEDPVRSFCGKLEYTFSSFVTAPAEFYLGMTTVENGKFTAVTALNVTRPENITFSSTMENVPAPVFYPAGNNMAVALLPVPTSTPTGSYTLTFTYGGTTRETVLNVENTGVKISEYTVSEAVIQSTRNASALSQFESAAKEIMAKSSSERYFSGYFLEGVNATIKRGFGRDIYLNGSKTVSYINNGVDYASDAGIEVAACNAGEVVFAGTLDYAGNMIVIDHGYGLKTWYYNLGAVSVSVGTRVERGTPIGATGQTGFTGQTGAHIAMSVGETFVSPYDTWQDSSRAGKVIIAKIDE